MEACGLIELFTRFKPKQDIHILSQNFMKGET